MSPMATRREGGGTVDTTSSDCCSEYPHYVTIIAAGASNAYGERAAGAERVRRAYVDPMEMKQRSTNEDDKDSGSSITVEDIEVQLDDKVVLPDGTVWKIARIQRFDFDPDMLHSIVVIV